MDIEYYKCVSVALVIKDRKIMFRIILSSVAMSGCTMFFHINGPILGGKIFLNIKMCFFLLTL